MKGCPSILLILKISLPGKEIGRVNKIEGQPFMVHEIVDGVKNILAEI